MRTLVETGSASSSQAQVTPPASGRMAENAGARAASIAASDVQNMNKADLRRLATSLGVNMRANRKTWTLCGRRVQSQRCVKTARLGRRLSRSVLEHTQVSQALPALAWPCGQLRVGPRLRRPSVRTRWSQALPARARPRHRRRRWIVTSTVPAAGGEHHPTGLKHLQRR